MPQGSEHRLGKSGLPFHCVRPWDRTEVVWQGSKHLSLLSLLTSPLSKFRGLARPTHPQVCSTWLEHVLSEYSAHLETGRSLSPTFPEVIEEELTSLERLSFHH